jgi:hypothetical protein
LKRSPLLEVTMDIETSEMSDERGGLHFVAALMDELMQGLIERQLMTRADVQEIENRAAKRVGSIPRAW